VGRDKSIWGEDAAIFNPERWFRESVKDVPTTGVYGNL
jgi:hypothetical protein